MSEVTSRESIAQAAELAAHRVADGEPVKNPYPDGSDAALAWTASLERHLHAMTAPAGCEGGA